MRPRSLLVNHRRLGSSIRPGGKAVLLLRVILQEPTSPKVHLWLMVGNPSPEMRSAILLKHISVVLDFLFDRLLGTGKFALLHSLWHLAIGLVSRDHSVVRRVIHFVRHQVSLIYALLRCRHIAISQHGISLLSLLVELFFVSQFVLPVDLDRFLVDRLLSLQELCVILEVHLTDNFLLLCLFELFLVDLASELFHPLLVHSKLLAGEVVVRVVNTLEAVGLLSRRHDIEVLKLFLLRASDLVHVRLLSQGCFALGLLEVISDGGVTAAQVVGHGPLIF